MCWNTLSGHHHVVTTLKRGDKSKCEYWRLKNSLVQRNRSFSESVSTAFVHDCRLKAIQCTKQSWWPAVESTELQIPIALNSFSFTFFYFVFFSSVDWLNLSWLLAVDWLNVVFAFDINTVQVSCPDVLRGHHAETFFLVNPLNMKIELQSSISVFRGKRKLISISLA